MLSQHNQAFADAETRPTKWKPPVGKYECNLIGFRMSSYAGKDGAIHGLFAFNMVIVAGDYDGNEFEIVDNTEAIWKVKGHLTACLGKLPEDIESGVTELEPIAESGNLLCTVEVAPNRRGYIEYYINDVDIAKA